MAQTNIFTNKFYLLILLFSLTKLSIAQRLGIKPFLGVHYNTTRVINHDNLLFTDVGLGHIRSTFGLLLTYQITPKWGAEFGFTNTPTILNYTVKNPITNENGGSITEGRRYLNFQLNGSFLFYEKASWYKLKVIGGFELNNKKFPLIQMVNKPDQLDTNIVNVNFINTTKTYSKLTDPLFGLINGITAGIGSELLIKKKVVAELRISTRYVFYPGLSSSINYEVNGTNFANEIVARNLSFNAIVLINLSTLLGSKWRD